MAYSFHGPTHTGTKRAFSFTGLHYWYNVRKDMDCNEFFPVFLLYNDGVLNAFGWAFGLNIQTSSRFEHPPQTIYNVSRLS